MAYKKKSTSKSSKPKKTAPQIIIDRFLEDVDKNGKMPWQMPYERYSAINYFTGRTYRGINRLLLPTGEYMTKKQLENFNIRKGYIEEDENGKVIKKTEDAFQFIKGIEWWLCYLFVPHKEDVTEAVIQSLFPDYDLNSKDGTVGYEKGSRYIKEDGKYYKTYSVKRFYTVTERKFIKNGRGETLPSKFDTSEVKIVKENPQKVIKEYINRSGVRLEQTSDIPCYIPALDTVQLNPYMKSEDSWFATAFHELGHSTGAKNRLNREGITSTEATFGTDLYAQEECVAEICACLCCAETGIYDFKTSGTEQYENNIAYVQGWKERIRNWGSSFMYICNQADKAFDYICHADTMNDQSVEKVKKLREKEEKEEEEKNKK